MRKTLLSVPLVVGVAAGSIACATKGYVNQGIAEVNEKVETLSEVLKETQEQTRKNAAGVAEAQGQAPDVGQHQPGGGHDRQGRDHLPREADVVMSRLRFGGLRISVVVAAPDEVNTRCLYRHGTDLTTATEGLQILSRSGRSAATAQGRPSRSTPP